jgi:hypothetical protein
MTTITLPTELGPNYPGNRETPGSWSCLVSAVRYRHPVVDTLRLDALNRTQRPHRLMNKELDPHTPFRGSNLRVTTSPTPLATGCGKMDHEHGHQSRSLASIGHGALFYSRGLCFSRVSAGEGVIGSSAW